MIELALLLTLAAPAQAADTAEPLEPLPERVVVLTFDDGVRSHFTVVRPILLELGFSATFFVTEGFTFPSDKRNYMSWDQIRQLHDDGFEIGNHTRDHVDLTPKNVKGLAKQVEAIARKLERHGIPRPVSFAYPGNVFHRAALPILEAAGIRWARRGGTPERPYSGGRGVAYRPGVDHPLLIPSAGDARPEWSLKDFEAALETAADGDIPVLQFHGVPDLQHPWVSTTRGRFREYMGLLHERGYRALALRDLERFVDRSIQPDDPEAIIRLRMQR